MLIRQATIHDAEDIAAVYTASWRSTYQGIIPHAQLERLIRKRNISGWRRVIARDRGMLVLVFDDSVVGYASFGLNRDTRLPFEAEIFEFYITPVYQGLGFGVRLFDAVRQRQAGLGLQRLVVWALEDNDIACQFYRNRGGRIVKKTTESFGPKRLTKIAFGWPGVAGNI